MYKGFDASTPPVKAPVGMQVVFGYIGGPTPHVWSRGEWDRFNGLKKVPIQVASIAGGQSVQPEIEAFQALEMCYRLGVPQGTPIVWDMEAQVNPPYVSRVCKVLHWAGYRMWVYGSANYVFRNPVCDGYHVADYRGIGPFAYPHANVRATQYQNGTYYDYNVIQRWQYLFRLKAW